MSDQKSKARQSIDKIVKDPVYSFGGEGFVEPRARGCIYALLDYAEGLERRVDTLERRVADLEKYATPHPPG